MGLDPRQEKFIAELYAELRPLLRNLARGGLYDQSFADEVVQDTFRVACAYADKLMRSPNPKGWIVNAAYHVIDRVNKSNAELSNHLISCALMERLPADAQYEDAELFAACENILGKDDYRLLILIVRQHCTLLEASQELHISLAACAKRYQRARQKLKKYLKNN